MLNNVQLYGSSHVRRGSNLFLSLSLLQIGQVLIVIHVVARCIELNYTELLRCGSLLFFIRELNKFIRVARLLFHKLVSCNTSLLLVDLIFKCRDL